MALIDEATRVIELMNEHEVPYVLIGGLAVGCHGHPRATRDIDILIPDHPNLLQRLDIMLETQGWMLNHGEIPLRNAGTIHRWIKVENNELIMLDVMVSPQNPQWLDDKVQVDLNETKCWLIGRQHLIAMKKAAGRPVDLGDVANLESIP